MIGKHMSGEQNVRRRIVDPAVRCILESHRTAQLRVEKASVITSTSGDMFAVVLRSDHSLWSRNIAAHSVDVEISPGAAFDGVAATPTCCVAYSVAARTLVVAEFSIAVTHFHLEDIPAEGKVIVVVEEESTNALTVALVFQSVAVIIEICLGAPLSVIRSTTLRTPLDPSAAAFVATIIGLQLVIASHDATINYFNASSGIQTGVIRTPNEFGPITCLYVLRAFPSVVLAGGTTGAVAALQMRENNDGPALGPVVVVSTPITTATVSHDEDPGQSDPVRAILFLQHGVQCLRESSGLQPLLLGHNISPEDYNDIHAAAASDDGTTVLWCSHGIMVCDSM